MKKYFYHTKPLLILLGILFALYWLFKVFVLYASSLRVVELVFLSLFLGIGPAYFFRRVFKFDNIIGWLVNSSVLGMLFIPFLFLLFGWIGFNAVFVYSVWFIYACAFWGIISLLVFSDKNILVEYIKLPNFSMLDIFFYIVLFGYTLILTLLNFHWVYPGWDAFTLWGLDANYMFQFNHLRDASIDVFGSFTYTSYYPIYYSLIYDLYGAVVEQYANWVNVFFNFLALMLIYNNIIKKSAEQKGMIVAVLVATSYGAITAVLMLLMYADMLDAFNMLLFMVVLTNDDEYPVELYGKRTILLLLLAVSFYFIKTPFLFLTVILILSWMVYDIKFLLGNWRNLLNRADFLFPVGVVVALYIMRFNYFGTIVKAQSDTPVDGLLLPVASSLSLYFLYAKELFVWLFETSPYLVGLWLLGICFILLIRKMKLDKGDIHILFVSLFVFLFYCGFDILYLGSVYHYSLPRYTAISMYLIPLMLGRLSIVLPQKISYSLTSVFLLVISYFFVKTMTPMPLHEGFQLSTGSYNVFMPEYSLTAEDVLGISGGNARILIADDYDNKLISNMFPPAIYVRYFLMYNSVGGQYVSLHAKDLQKYALGYNADYILLLDYDSSLDYCDDTLVAGQSYLIKIDKNGIKKEEECAFSEESVIKLKQRY